MGLYQTCVTVALLGSVDVNLEGVDGMLEAQDVTLRTNVVIMLGIIAKAGGWIESEYEIYSTNCDQGLARRGRTQYTSGALN